jgi:hypothetical protein
MHAILRSAPVIASGVDDQRYALGDCARVRRRCRRPRGGHSVADEIVDASPLATLATRFEPRVPEARWPTGVGRVALGFVGARMAPHDARLDRRAG